MYAMTECKDTVTARVHASQTVAIKIFAGMILKHNYSFKSLNL